jgi:hypothetical protein
MSFHSLTATASGEISEQIPRRGAPKVKRQAHDEFHYTYLIHINPHTFIMAEEATVGTYITSSGCTDGLPRYSFFKTLHGITSID